MDAASYVSRRLEPELERTLARGKSITLRGPRQTGRTTVLEGLAADPRLPLVVPGTRQLYERDPGQLLGEVEALRKQSRRRPVVVLDEVQKVPALPDVVFWQQLAGALDPLGK